MVEPCAGNALARGEIILEDGMRLDRGQTLSVCALESQRTLCVAIVVYHVHRRNYRYAG